MNSYQLLMKHIVPFSKSNDPKVARKEWVLVDVRLYDSFYSCPCGHRIKELCFIENKFTGRKTYVGNVCIKKFLGIDTGRLFDGLKRIANNNRANANEDLIIYAYKFGYIYDNEYNFLVQTKNKRKLTEKQFAWKK